jgi:hypothetical protein
VHDTAQIRAITNLVVEMHIPIGVRTVSYNEKTGQF